MESPLQFIFIWQLTIYPIQLILQRQTIIWPDQQLYKLPIAEHIQMPTIVFIILLKAVGTAISRLKRCTRKKEDKQRCYVHKKCG